MFKLVNGSNKSVELENVKSLFFVDGDETKVVEQDYRADLEDALWRLLRIIKIYWIELKSGKPL